MEGKTLCVGREVQLRAVRGSASPKQNRNKIWPAGGADFVVVTWEDRYRSEVIDLWNREAVKDGYKEPTKSSFDRVFTSNPYFDRETVRLLLDDSGRVRGFACGCTGDDLPLGEAAGYITCIVLAEDHQTEAHYRK